MELVRTYDNVGNISEQVYIENSNGNLVEVFNLETGEVVNERPVLRRIYYEAVEKKGV